MYLLICIENQLKVSPFEYAYQTYDFIFQKIDKLIFLKFLWIMLKRVLFLVKRTKNTKEITCNQMLKINTQIVTKHL